MKLLGVLAGVLLLSLSACGGGGTDPVLGDIEGTVLDASGNRIAGTALILTRTGRTPKNATSDAQGDFSFDRVQPGNWNLEITPPSAYETPTTQANPLGVIVIGNRTATVTVRVARKGGGGPVDTNQ